MKNQPLVEIRVTTGEALSVEGGRETVVMIPFTCEASGPLFSGTSVGAGVDTQRVAAGRPARLSARYMLEGVDRDGRRCRVFIENEGSFEAGFRPRIVTDSAALRRWEDAALSATAEIVPGGVRIRIFPQDDPE